MEFFIIIVKYSTTSRQPLVQQICPLEMKNHDLYQTSKISESVPKNAVQRQRALSQSKTAVYTAACIFVIIQFRATVVA